MNWEEVYIYVHQSINSLYHSTPNYLLFTLVIVLLVSGILVVSTRKIEHKGRKLGLIMFIEYFILLYCITFFLRPIQEKSSFNFQLLWSYKAFNDGVNAVMAEKLLNIVVFVPVGLLIGIAFKKTGWLQVFIMTTMLSVSIELMQFLLRRGFAETDDVLHNVAGSLVGFGIYKTVIFVYERVTCLR